MDKLVTLLDLCPSSSSHSTNLRLFCQVAFLSLKGAAMDSCMNGYANWCKLKVDMSMHHAYDKSWKTMGDISRDHSRKFPTAIAPVRWCHLVRSLSANLQKRFPVWPKGDLNNGGAEKHTEGTTEDTQPSLLVFGCVSSEWMQNLGTVYINCMGMNRKFMKCVNPIVHPFFTIEGKN